MIEKYEYFTFTKEQVEALRERLLWMKENKEVGFMESIEDLCVETGVMEVDEDGECIKKPYINN